MTQHAHQMLALEDSRRFQHLERWLTRFGWVVLALFVLAGLVGLLGPGPLSGTVAGQPGDDVRVEHQRITHYEAEDTLTLRVAERAIEGDTLAVELTGEWLQGADISSVSPEPDAQRTIPGGVVYEFAVERPADVDVTLSFRAQQVGRLPLTVSAGSSTVSLSQVVLP